jgi:hypothetical protein
MGETAGGSNALVQSNLRDMGTHLLRLTHRRALSEGIDLPWLCSCAAEQKCRSFGACWPAASAAWGLLEVTANLPDRSRLPRFENVRVEAALQRTEELS